MLSMCRSAEDYHFYEFTRKYGNPAEKPTYTHASSFPTLQRSFSVSFPSQPLSVYRDGRKAHLWCTLYTAGGELQFLSVHTPR